MAATGVDTLTPGAVPTAAAGVVSGVAVGVMPAQGTLALVDRGAWSGNRAARVILMLAAAESGQSTPPAWLTLAVAALVPLAALAGVFASLRIETKRSRDAREQEREVRNEERALRAADYQRETLHDLQQAVSTYAASSGGIRRR